MRSPATVSSGNAAHTISLEDAWISCADLYQRLAAQRSQPSLDDIHAELLFCLLGGFGVSYELNRSATDVVADLRPFDANRSEDELRTRLETTLNAPRFEPRCADGRLRRYRFPTRKAALIVSARRWLYEHPQLHRTLPSLSGDKQRRDLMCTCPGVGPKTASWLLRNLGLARNLAVLDVHVVRALGQAGRLARSPVLPRDYEVVEAAFLSWCRELGAAPAAFDLFVWDWQRGALGT